MNLYFRGYFRPLYTKSYSGNFKGNFSWYKIQTSWGRFIRSLLTCKIFTRAKYFELLHTFHQFIPVENIQIMKECGVKVDWELMIYTHLMRNICMSAKFLHISSHTFHRYSTGKYSNYWSKSVEYVVDFWTGRARCVSWWRFSKPVSSLSSSAQ